MIARLSANTAGTAALIGTALTTLALLPAVPTPAAANPLSFDISAGLEYDSNVSVIELDQNTTEGDFAALLDAGVELALEPGDSTEVSLAYDFSQSLQFKFTDFDIRTHRGTVGVEQEIGPINAGLSYMYADSSLGGDRFLTMQRLSPSIAGLIGRSLYLRAVYDYTDKEFEGRPVRDSETHGGGLTAFVFLDGTDTFVTAGYQYEDENAVAEQYDFVGHNVRLSLSHDFRMFGREAELGLGWRYEKRDYSGITPSIGEERADNRHRFETSIEIPLFGPTYAEVSYRYDDYSSNLPSADFTQSVATLLIGAEF